MPALREAEARAIREAALAEAAEADIDLARFVRGLFAPLDGVTLDLPAREPGRETPGCWWRTNQSTSPDDPPTVIVLDTNVLSELARADPDAAVATWVAQQR